MRCTAPLYSTVFALLLTFCSNLAMGDESKVAAIDVLDTFMSTFNDRDTQAWAKTLHFPHVRFASGTVTVYPDATAFERHDVFPRLIETGWHHSSWTKRSVTMSSKTKVHIETEFERFNERNESIGRYQSLYIVTKHQDGWGIQARSSLAP